MNTSAQYSKRCSRCPLVIRMTREQFEKEKDQAETTCERCRAILTAEAAEVLRNLHPFPKDEAKTSTPAPGETNR